MHPKKLSADTPRPWQHLQAPGRLRRWRTRAKLTQRAAAREFGFDVVKLNSFELARARPCLDIAAAIERGTDGAVPAILWAQPLGQRGNAA